MHSPDHRTYEGEELRKGHKKCSCPIYVSGTLAGKFKRVNTEHTSWPEAKAVAAAREAIAAWHGVVAVLPVAASAPTAERMTIEKARELFLEDHHSAPATQKKYREVMRRLVGYRTDYVFVDPVCASDPLPTQKGAGCGEERVSK
jgi:hypothetical protein